MNHPDSSPEDSVTAAIANAHLTITIAVLGSLYDAAVEQRHHAMGLVIAQNPGLVGPDGEPVSRPARRTIERKVRDGQGQEQAAPAVSEAEQEVVVS